MLDAAGRAQISEIVSAGLAGRRHRGLQRAGEHVDDRIVDLLDAAVYRPARRASGRSAAAPASARRRARRPRRRTTARRRRTACRCRARRSTTCSRRRRRSACFELVHEVRGFAHDHRGQALRHRHQHDPVDGERLQHGQRRVRRPGRQIDEQVVEIRPQRLLVELADDAREDRTAPDHRGVLLVRQQVRADDLDRRARRRRHHQRLGLLAGRRRRIGLETERLRQPEQARDRRAGDVGVEDADLLAGAAQADGQQRGRQRLADAALARHDRRRRT